MRQHLGLQTKRFVVFLNHRCQHDVFVELGHWQLALNFGQGNNRRKAAVDLAYEIAIRAAIDDCSKRRLFNEQVDQQ